MHYDLQRTRAIALALVAACIALMSTPALSQRALSLERNTVVNGRGVLRVDRIGSIHVGMSLDELMASGLRVSGGGPYGTATSFAGRGCELGQVSTFPGVSIMFKNSHIVRFFVTSKKIRTDRGAHVGDSVATIVKAYPGIKPTRGVYGETYFEWSPGGSLKSYRMLFISNNKRVVDIIISGRLPEVHYEEGCL